MTDLEKLVELKRLEMLQAEHLQRAWAVNGDSPLFDKEPTETDMAHDIAKFEVAYDLAVRKYDAAIEVYWFCQGANA